MFDLRKCSVCIALVLALVGCGTGYEHSPIIKNKAMPDLPDIQMKLAFTCAYEKDKIPPRDPEADQLYKHARWLEKGNRLKEDPKLFPTLERLIRIATAYGHDKANMELRQMIGEGQAVSESPVAETLALTENLIARGIPGGYYDMGRYLERGYGVKQDKELAWKYYRKSADLGSPEGQFAVAEMLAPIDAAPEIADKMWLCAAKQGYGKAAVSFGVSAKSLGRYSEALEAFHFGVRAGNDIAASYMEKGFDSPLSNDRIDYLAVEKDEERVRRYKIIGAFLSDYSYLNPKVPELDKIVPLPPAKLPPWDGSFQWLKEHEANVPPPLPSEARIVEMAKAKGLDPETGRPVRGKRERY